MELSNFINIRVRGEVSGQQWQSSWNLGVVTVAGDSIGTFTFRQDLLLEWFDRYWNGGAAAPVGGGIVDRFRSLAAQNVSINNVRVLARNQSSMNTPVQLELFGVITGQRTTPADQVLPSFNAVSFLARKDDYGGRGAAMRWPLGREADASGQYWTSTFVDELQVFADALVGNANLAALEVRTGGANAYVEAMQGVVVENVFPPVVTSDDRKEFPYEFPRPINAFTLTGWTLHPWISTQNSRKIGRGN